LHDHSHNHKENNTITLATVLILTALYMSAEFFGGLYSNSLALIADSGHMLSDAAALGLSLYAAWLVQKSASPEKTYGYHRTEILAAFVNGIVLVLIAAFIIWEAYLRFYQVYQIKPVSMIIIASGGLLINLIGAFLLYKPAKESLNVHGAFLHVIGDLLGSIGTIIAGICILFWNIRFADPIISIFIAILVLFSAVRLVIEATNILLEFSPSHINVKDIENSIKELPNVIDVHDLHVWSLSSNNIALSVHIIAEESNSHKILCEVKNLLHEKFNINHITVQIEPEGFHETICKF
jgi:cobalt-zinc-cadmium efflux system protein